MDLHHAKYRATSVYFHTKYVIPCSALQLLAVKLSALHVGGEGKIDHKGLGGD